MNTFGDVGIFLVPQMAASLPPLSGGLKPPTTTLPEVKLDTASFTQTLKLIALRIPTAQCNVFLKRFQKTPYARPRIHPFQPLNRRRLIVRSLSLSFQVRVLPASPETHCGRPEPAAHRRVCRIGRRRRRRRQRRRSRCLGPVRRR
jgi:hypothetical protein